MRADVLQLGSTLDFCDFSRDSLFGAAGVSVQRRDRCTGTQFGSQLFLIFRCEI